MYIRVGTNIAFFKTRDGDPSRYTYHFSDTIIHGKKNTRIDVHQHDSNLSIDSNHSKIKINQIIPISIIPQLSFILSLNMVRGTWNENNDEECLMLLYWLGH
jgi:hypothetical protein